MFVLLSSIYKDVSSLHKYIDVLGNLEIYDFTAEYEKFHPRQARADALASALVSSSIPPAPAPVAPSLMSTSTLLETQSLFMRRHMSNWQPNLPPLTPTPTSASEAPMTACLEVSRSSNLGDSRLPAKRKAVDQPEHQRERNILASLKELMVEFEQRIDDKLKAYTDGVRETEQRIYSRIDDLDDKLKAYTNDVRETEEGIKTHIDKKFREAEKHTNKSIVDNKEQIMKSIVGLKKDINGDINTLSTKVDEGHNGIYGEIDNMNKRFTLVLEDILET
ncbi:hypothetical protein ACHAPV_007832 [Trichoderma viride]